MMRKESELDIRKITKAYIQANRWSVNDMSFILGVPQSTLSEWLSGKKDLTVRNRRYLSAFLNGDYIKDISAVTNYMLLKEDIENPEIINSDDRKLNIRDIVIEFLKANRWSISDMAYFIKIPRTTLAEWILGKHDLSEKNIQKVKDFLGGVYVTPVEEIIKELINES